MIFDPSLYLKHRYLVNNVRNMAKYGLFFSRNNETKYSTFEILKQPLAWAKAKMKALAQKIPKCFLLL
jgi:hypothetical protein